MEHAGRNLARRVLERRAGGRVVVLAGAGGNGGGGLACAPHLTNRNVRVTVMLDRTPEKIEGATATQHRILESADVTIDAETLDRELPTVRPSTRSSGTDVGTLPPGSLRTESDGQGMPTRSVETPPRVAASTPADPVGHG